MADPSVVGRLTTVSIILVIKWKNAPVIYEFWACFLFIFWFLFFFFGGGLTWGLMNSLSLSLSPSCSLSLSLSVYVTCCVSDLDILLVFFCFFLLLAFGFGWLSVLLLTFFLVLASTLLRWLLLLCYFLFFLLTVFPVYSLSFSLFLLVCSCTSDFDVNTDTKIISKIGYIRFYLSTTISIY